VGIEPFGSGIFYSYILPGSSMVGSMLFVLQLSVYLLKMSIEEAIDAVTANAAYPLRRHESISSLEVGKVVVRDGCRVVSRVQNRRGSTRLLSDLFSDRLQLVLENRGEREEPLQRHTAVITAMGASRDPARGCAEPDRAVHGMGRAHPLSRRAAVADAHFRADILGAELLRPFFRGRFESSPVIILGGDMGFAVSAIKAAIGLDLGHVSSLPGA
jgi:hypothetical protein